MEGQLDATQLPLREPYDTIHITLIHGTFAPGAAWTKPGSLLRNHIAEHLGDRVEFHSEFWWWGLPSHLNRHLAARRLRKYLLDLTVRHPGKHFLIGHSHGALVALYAVRDQELANRIEGIISLSTPYLIARPRELSVFGMIAVIFGCLALFALPASFSSIPFSVFLSADLPWYLGVPIFLIGLAMPILGLAALAGIFSGVEKLGSWFLTTMKIPTIHSGRLLIVRGPSDEASALITLFHALELLVTAVWGRRGPFDRIIFATGKRISKFFDQVFYRIPVSALLVATVWFRISALLLLAGILSVAILTFKFPEQAEELRNTAWAPIYPRFHIWGALHIGSHYVSELLPTWLVWLLSVAAFPAFFIFFVAGLLLSLAVSAGIFLGLGFFAVISATAFLAITSVPELGPCAATVVVSVEATPPGRYEVESGDDTTQFDAFLTHSWSYSHHQALAAIAVWLKTPKPDAPLIPPLPEVKASDPFW